MNGPVLQGIVSVERLTHIYNGGTPLEKRAIANISLQIGRGECVGIVGETGSGKTTLVQHFNGLLKPSSGRVLVDGQDVNGPGVSLAELRQRVGLVFQYPEHQLFEETVFDDISFVLRQRRILSPREIEDRVRKACTAVGLDYERFRRRSPFDLSSGEMRRVALAGVLAQDPFLLILDEPTVGLDHLGKREILREIRTLKSQGKTIVIISHVVEDLLEIVDRLIVLERGEILTLGSPGEVFSSLLQARRSEFLIPPIARLFHDLRSRGWDIPGDLFQVEEALRVLDQFLRRPPLQWTEGRVREN